MAIAIDAMIEIGYLVQQRQQNRSSQRRQRDPYVPDIWGCAGVLQAAEPEGVPEQCAPLTLTRPVHAAALGLALSSITLRSGTKGTAAAPVQLFFSVFSKREISAFLERHHPLLVVF